MIRVEKIGQAWDVRFRADDLAKEFALVASVVLQYMELDEVIGIVRHAAEHKDEIFELSNEQSKTFVRRLYHLLEVNSTSMTKVASQLNLPKDNIEDIVNGVIPSTESLKKIAQYFNVTQEYLIGAENGADQRTD